MVGLGIPGEPKKFRLRMILEPVSEDWDGDLVPLDDINYRPPEPDQPIIIDTNPKPPSEDRP